MQVNYKTLRIATGPKVQYITVRSLTATLTEDLSPTHLQKCLSTSRYCNVIKIQPTQIQLSLSIFKDKLTFQDGNRFSQVLYIFLVLAFKQLVDFYFDDKSLMGIEIPHNFCIQSSALSLSILAQSGYQYLRTIFSVAPLSVFLPKTKTKSHKRKLLSLRF